MSELQNASWGCVRAHEQPSVRRSTYRLLKTNSRVIRCWHSEYIVSKLEIAPLSPDDSKSPRSPCGWRMTPWKKEKQKTRKKKKKKLHQLACSLLSRSYSTFSPWCWRRGVRRRSYKHPVGESSRLPKHIPFHSLVAYLCRAQGRIGGRRVVADATGTSFWQRGCGGSRNGKLTSHCEKTKQKKKHSQTPRLTRAHIQYIVP